MLRSILLTVLCMATVTACASTQGTSALEARAHARVSGLESTSISSGACDDAGQFILGKPDHASFLEASAMPLH
jgi:hypothetical protein